MWRGKDKTGTVLDSEKIKGPLSKGLKLALQFIERNTKTGWKKTPDGGREEIRSYPKEAIREAMVNAIAHRDYSIYGTQIDVDIYSDRIDIVSPGSWLLPKDYNEYPLGAIPSIRRNTIIAACLDVANLMERGGTGFQTMIESYKDSTEEKQPCVMIYPGFLDLRLFDKLYQAEETFVELSDTEKIIKLLKESPRSAKELQAVTSYKSRSRFLKEIINPLIEEGKIDDKLSVFPLAKSTEVLFVNKTLFDRFAKETGASVEQLSTWEGLFQVAQKYYDWTNAKTPDIDNDGKTFFAHDYHFNYLQVGVESMGESFFEGDGIKDSVELKRAFKLYADAAINGTIWVNEGFATEPLRTGEVISSVASSASVLYYDDYVTYDDNTTEFVEFIALPVPVFEGADNLVMQRGAGVCTIKSIPEKEKAAATFLRWITSPENNTRLVTQLGYMPVTEKAFPNISTAISEIESKKYKSLYEAFQKTQQNFTFYSAPKHDNYLEMETLVEKTSRSMMKARRDELLKNGGNIDTLIENAYKEFIEIKP